MQLRDADLSTLSSRIDATWFGSGLSEGSLERLASMAREYESPAGARLLREGGQSDPSRATLGMRLATGRPPTEEELEILTAQLASQRAHYRAAPEAARALIETGDSSPDPSLDPVELAAHTALARVLLNLDETITKQ